MTRSITTHFRRISIVLYLTFTAMCGVALAADGAPSPATAPGEHSVPAPRGMKMAVDMIGPVTQTTDLQIICLLKHNPGGDKYIEAMQDLNDKLGGLLSCLRRRVRSTANLGRRCSLCRPRGQLLLEHFC